MRRSRLFSGLSGSDNTQNKRRRLCQNNDSRNGLRTGVTVRQSVGYAQFQTGLAGVGRCERCTGAKLDLLGPLQIDNPIASAVVIDGKTSDRSC